jgi:hypothetical protein
MAIRFWLLTAHGQRFILEKTNADYAGRVICVERLDKISRPKQADSNLR